MSFSDDHGSSAAPFSGGDAGDIFDYPDVARKSPPARERSVDTQSGFLVVVRAGRDGQQVSMRRRLGTPPSSTLKLTPDESVKLARILTDGVVFNQGRVSTGLSRLARAWKVSEPAADILAHPANEPGFRRNNGPALRWGQFLLFVVSVFLAGLCAGYFAGGILQ